ncbi:glycoside hydrolase family 16 protein [Mixia osmundae IAM 14324]|uniref:glycoside hydrolase family 16 protein n=1 Tax=Mixia osmundae (strain CBS 9802 / IAM 14324 / JCM 22182 / KY 12970) TaxID=764103 RepID=UPI0004A55963|nr:glycoside hydrolase family 16 protein [Mixia osmundae IAM 14324]KEI42258.1 glycoside hydrolase family 16 protein [Mixia osmundae IAM 14324]
MLDKLKRSRAKLVWQETWSADYGSRWTAHEGGGGFGNEEIQHYSDAQVQCAPSHLTVHGHSDPEGNSFKSAKLICETPLGIPRGYIEAQVKHLPCSSGLWPALWLLPKQVIDGSIQWPALGEVDIMETFGLDEQVTHAAHWGTHHLPEDGGKHHAQSHAHKPSQTVGLAFWPADEHGVRLEWYSDRERVAECRCPSPPFAKDLSDFCLILSLSHPFTGFSYSD